jgi:hypothetical protein
MRSELSNLRVALLAVLLVFGWQFATVQANYQGNWTALFSIGGNFQRPPELAAGAWTFPASNGYDGQWYRAIAHDPWLQKGYWHSLDNTGRTHRILLPAIAWILALGQAPWIDGAYIAAVLGFAFLGVWITAKWSAEQGQSPWWGLAFAFLPGTLITVDRMTVDVTEYALLVCSLYFWKRRWWMACALAGAAAFLTRELGLLVILAMVFLSLVEHAWKRAVLMAAGALPGLLWNAYVQRMTAVAGSPGVIPQWVSPLHLMGSLQAILRPPDYALPRSLLQVTQWLDRLAIAGVVAAVLLAMIGLFPRPLRLESILSALYIPVFALVSERAFWMDPLSYSRAFTPLAGLVAWRAVTEAKWWCAAPLLCMLPRIVWQLGPQALGIAKTLVPR